MSLVEAIHRLERPLLIALDVDGTLAPIVENPADAKVPRDVLADLRRLMPHVSVALVTGRDEASLARIAPVSDVHRAVEHGRVVLAPGETSARRPLDPAVREVLERFEQLATQRFGPRGARVEVKPTARAVHVRGLAETSPDAAEAILVAAEELAAELGLHGRRGRAVLEAESYPGDKGAALDRLIEMTRAVSVVYVGDDLTDAPAIEKATLAGIGLFVTSPERPESPTACTATLSGPDAVAELLRELADLLDGSG